MNNQNRQNRQELPADPRPTVIPVRRDSSMVPGWGVKV